MAMAMATATAPRPANCGCFIWWFNGCLRSIFFSTHSYPSPRSLTSRGGDFGLRLCTFRLDTCSATTSNWKAPKAGPLIRDKWDPSSGAPALAPTPTPSPTALSVPPGVSFSALFLQPVTPLHSPPFICVPVDRRGQHRTSHRQNMNKRLFLIPKKKLCPTTV